jgi:hypothetical protein
MRNETKIQAQISRLLQTIQEFIDTNPNEVTTLADNSVLVAAIRADLRPRDAVEVN